MLLINYLHTQFMGKIHSLSFAVSIYGGILLIMVRIIDSTINHLYNKFYVALSLYYKLFVDDLLNF